MIVQININKKTLSTNIKIVVIRLVFNLLGLLNTLSLLGERGIREEGLKMRD
jgi:hypothetical protein